MVLTPAEMRGIRNILPVGVGTKPKSYFTRSLRKLYLRGNDTYWHKIRNRLPVHIQQCIPTPSMDEDHVNAVVNDGDDEIQFEVDNTSDINESSNNLHCQTGVFHQGSDYMVPSQLSQVENETHGTINNSQEYAATLPVPAQGSDLKSDYMPVYETLCKFSQSAGREGRVALENGLNELRERQIELIAKKKMASATKNDVYSEYMHIYQNVCELASEAGEDGHQLLRDGLNKLKKDQAEIINKNNGQTNSSGLASMPMTSTKRIDKRIQARCSPNKKR